MSLRTSAKSVSGEFRAVGAEIRAGPVNQSLGSLKGITAWKDGTIYFASIDLWEGVKLDSLEVQLAQPGGVALGVQATLFGGSLRFDVSLNSEQGDDGGRFRRFGFEH